MCVCVAKDVNCGCNRGISNTHVHLKIPVSHILKC